MYTVTRIKGYVNRLPANALITTRELLQCGNRGAVDQAVYTLIKSGFLVRVSRGIFIKFDEGEELPSIDAVAAVKAKAFGKRILIDPEASQCAASTGPKYREYQTDGGPSSFVHLPTGVRVRFRRVASRKVQLGSGQDAQTIRALWSIGNGRLTQADFACAVNRLSRRHKESLRENMHLIPTWLNRYFHWHGTNDTGSRPD